MKTKFSKKLPAKVDKYEYYYELFKDTYYELCKDTYDKTRYGRFEIHLGRKNRLGNLELVKVYEINDSLEFYIRVYSELPDNVGRVADLEVGELQHITNYPIRFIQEHSHLTNFKVLLEPSLILGDDLNELLETYKFVTDKYGNKLYPSVPHAYYVASLVQKTESSALAKLRQSKFEQENNFKYPKTSAFILECIRVRPHMDYTDIETVRTYHTDA
jgi:hypothetical protein